MKSIICLKTEKSSYFFLRNGFSLKIQELKKLMKKNSKYDPIVFDFCRAYPVYSYIGQTNEVNPDIIKLVNSSKITFISENYFKTAMQIKQKKLKLELPEVN